MIYFQNVKRIQQQYILKTAFKVFANSTITLLSQISLEILRITTNHLPQIQLKMAQYIVLCRGNEGKTLQQLPYLQIRLYQLNKVNRQSILHQYQLINPGQQKQHIPINLVTKQRNYYIDTLLSQNSQFVIQTQNQQYLPSQLIINSKISLPLVLQLIYPANQFHLQSHAIPTLNHFTILHKLSQGAFAEVFLAQIKYNRNLVAIKRINKSQHLEMTSKKQLLNQIQIMKYRYWGKVSLMWAFQNQLFVFLVMDYCIYGTVYDLLSREKDVKGKQDKCQQCQVLTKEQKISIWLQISFTIAHMHSKGFLYRDLKPQNILIDHNGFAKLCDFGHSIPFKPGQKFTQICGTLQYISPQLVLNKQYDKTIDIYALGIFLYELICGRTPFHNITFENMKQLKTEREIKFDKKLFTNEQISLIKSLTSIKPQLRLGYTNTINIFRHPFFQQQHIKELIKSIMMREIDYQLLMKLNCRDMEKGKDSVERREISPVIGMTERFLQKPFNYLDANKQVELKIGPKFNSAF